MSSRDIFVEKISNLSNLINKVIVAICTCSFSLILVFLVISIFFRYVLNSPIGWMTNVSRYILIWTGLLSISTALYKKSHIAINFLYNRLPDKLRLVVNIIFRILIVYYLYVLVRYGWIMSLKSMSQTIPTLRISMFWVFVAIPISSLITLIQFILTSVEDIYKNRSLYIEDF